MDLQEILSVALGTLVVVVVAHIAVFWVVRTLYPPTQVQVQAQPVFTPPPIQLQPEPEQHVSVPTYTPPVPVEAPRQEGEHKGPPPAESTSIRGESGVDSTNPRG